MSLSEHERRQLDDIERRLTGEDPEVAREMGVLPVRPWGVLVGAIMLIGGITMLVVGAVLGAAPVLGIGVFASMLFPVPMQIALHRRNRGRT